MKRADLLAAPENLTRRGLCSAGENAQQRRLCRFRWDSRTNSARPGPSDKLTPEKLRVATSRGKVVRFEHQGTT